MIILALRTEKPEAEIGLFDDTKELQYETWQAHRALAETLHATIHRVLNKQGLHMRDIEAIVCYKGPGSFTGLRIGLSVANALAASLEVPIVGMTGDDWARQGIKQIAAGNGHEIVVPEYGAPVHITVPKK